MKRISGHLASNILRYLLLVVICAGICIYLFRHRTDFYVIKEIDILMLVYLALLQIIIICSAVPRTRSALKSINLDISMADLYKILIRARFYNRFVPQFGNVYRAIVLKKTFHFPYSKYVAIFISINVINRLFSLAFAFFAVSIFHPDLSIVGISCRWGILIIFIFLIASLYVLNYFFKSISKIGKKRSRRIAKLTDVVGCFFSSISNKNVLITMLVFGLVSFLSGMLQNYLCFRALGSEMNIAKLSMYNLVLDIGRVVALTPGNIGVMESIYGLMGAGMKESVAKGMIVAMVINLVSATMIFVLGFSSGAMSIRKNLTDRYKEYLEPEG